MMKLTSQIRFGQLPNHTCPATEKTPIQLPRAIGSYELNMSENYCLSIGRLNQVKLKLPFNLFLPLLFKTLLEEGLGQRPMLLSFCRQSLCITSSTKAWLARPYRTWRLLYSYPFV
jgi:hypothetical protein